MASTDMTSKMARQEMVVLLRSGKPINEEQRQEINRALNEILTKKNERPIEFDPSSRVGNRLVANIIEKEIGENQKQPEEKPEELPRTEETEVTSRGLNSEELKILLEDYEKYRGKKLSEQEIATEVRKGNRLLQRVVAKEILAAIHRKIELEREALEKNLTPIQADAISDERLILEKRLVEEMGVEPEVAVKIVEKIGEIAKVEDTNEKRRVKIEILSREPYIPPEVGQEIRKIDKEIVVKEEIEKQVEREVEHLIARVEEVLTDKIGSAVTVKEEQKVKIREVARERIIAAVVRADGEINIRNVEFVAGEGVVGEQTTLSEEIAVVVDEKKVVEPKLWDQVIKEIQEEVVLFIGTEPEIVGDHRADLLENQVKVRVLEEEGLARITEETVGWIRGEGGITRVIKVTKVRVPAEEGVTIVGAPIESRAKELIKIRVPFESGVAEIAGVFARAQKEADFVVEMVYTNNPAADVVATIEARRVIIKEGNISQPGVIEEVLGKAKVMGQLIKEGKVPQTVGKILKLRASLDEIPQVAQVRRVIKALATAGDYPKVFQSIQLVSNIANVRWMGNRIVAGQLIARVGSLLGSSAIENVGVKIATFTLNGQVLGAMATHMAHFGLVQGVRSILGEIVATGTVKAVSSAAVKVGVGVGVKVAGAAAIDATAAAVGATGVGLPVAAVVFAVQLAMGIAKFVGKTLGKIWNGITTTLGIDSPATKIWLKENLGKFFGGIAGTAVDVGTIVIGGIGVVLGGLASTMVIWIVPGVILGLMGFQLLQMVQISQIVPPKGIGSTNCVLKDIAESEGQINCDQHAPENTVPGTNKSNFVRVANTWRSGKNYSEECYNDVVNRALCAGINPIYALWAWVHESGASNYSIPDVEDFGIHGQPAAPPKNFDAQIRYFLKLDPGKACLGAPKIGSDYWLGFASNYLNGTCDPDVPHPTTGVTGRQYLATMQETWGWVSSLPMPANIYYTGLGGKNCGSSSGETSGEIVSEYTDEQGRTWVCYDGGGSSGEGGAPDLGEWDPSVPVPEGCPHGLPTSGGFTQGPFANGCSHQSMSVPAIDQGAGMGTPIRATHPGVAVLNHDSVYGFYIDVHGKCEGKDFYTRYAHMPDGGFRVGNNEQVSAGQQIGVVDNTGSSTGSHLHYHITGLDKNKFGQYLGLSPETTQQLWGCCGSWNGVYCP